MSKAEDCTVTNLGKGPLENCSGEISQEEFEAVLKFIKDHNIPSSVPVASVIDFLKYPAPGKALRIR